MEDGVGLCLTVDLGVLLSVPEVTRFWEHFVLSPASRGTSDGRSSPYDNRETFEGTTAHVVLLRPSGSKEMGGSA